MWTYIYYIYKRTPDRDKNRRTRRECGLEWDEEEQNVYIISSPCAKHKHTKFNNKKIK